MTRATSMVAEQHGFARSACHLAGVGKSGSGSATDETAREPARVVSATLSVVRGIGHFLCRVTEVYGRRAR